MPGGLNLEAKRGPLDDENANGSNPNHYFKALDLSTHPQGQTDAQPSLPNLPKARSPEQPGSLRVSSQKQQMVCAESGTEPSLFLHDASEFSQALSSDSKSSKTVRFEAQPITAIWLAHSSKEYDRRSIVVDLSKTPFALFRKDAVLMKGAAAPCTPLRRPSPAAVDVSYQTQIPEVRSKSQFPSSLPKEITKLSRLEDSDASDSSIGHTDNETDLDPSDSDSSPRSIRMPGLRMGISETKPAFFGVWKRTSSEGYEKFLLSSGVPKKAAATALRNHPVHIIDHDSAYFRLIVKNGLSKVDNTFFIGDEPRVDKIGKQTYEVSLNWGNLSGYGSKEDLTLSSICHKKGEEVIAIRSLTEDGTRMILTQIVRRPAEQYEVQAKHFFKRITHKSELQSRGRVSSSHIVTVRARSIPQGSNAA